MRRAPLLANCAAASVFSRPSRPSQPSVSGVALKINDKMCFSLSPSRSLSIRRANAANVLNAERLRKVAAIALITFDRLRQGG